MLITSVLYFVLWAPWLCQKGAILVGELAGRGIEFIHSSVSYPLRAEERFSRPALVKLVRAPSKKLQKQSPRASLRQYIYMNKHCSRRGRKKGCWCYNGQAPWLPARGTKQLELCTATAWMTPEVRLSPDHPLRNTHPLPFPHLPQASRNSTNTAQTAREIEQHRERERKHAPWHTVSLSQWSATLSWDRIHCLHKPAQFIVA